MIWIWDWSAVSVVGGEWGGELGVGAAKMRCGEHFRSARRVERGEGREGWPCNYILADGHFSTHSNVQGRGAHQEGNIRERTQESNGRLYCVVKLHFGAFSLTLKDALFQCVFCCDSVLTDDHPQKTDIKLKIRNVMADLLFTEVYNPGEPDTMLLFFTV